MVNDLPKDVTPSLLASCRLGNYRLKNRIVMAPLTRRRATDDHIPTKLMKDYYMQRASAGMIIAEATNISPRAVGYMNSPGIFTQVQIEGWKRITEAVHAEGGLIFLQLWHVGRVSHRLLQPGKKAPVSSSAIKASGWIATPEGKQEMSKPRPLNIREISQTISDYKFAAKNAMKAGFDGIEIHGANGYLPDQFLHDGSNQRKDHYGGSVENRCRFILELVEACCCEVGSEKVGVRLSPSGINKDMYDSDPVRLYSYLIGSLNNYDLAYLHLMEPYQPLEPASKYTRYLKEVAPFFRKIFKGTLITNVGYTFQSGNKAIETGTADLVSFGKPFISNPDLVARFQTGAPLNHWDESTFYYGGEKGYTDYPTL